MVLYMFIQRLAVGNREEMERNREGDEERTMTRHVHPDTISMCNVLTINGDRHIIRNTIQSGKDVHAVDEGRTNTSSPSMHCSTTTFPMHSITANV